MKPLFSAVFLLVLCGSTLAQGPRPAVVDKAKLFSAEAIDRANRSLAEVRDRYKIELRVETLPELPPQDQAKFKALKSNSDKTGFLRETALDRAENERVDGLYLLVLTDPPVATLVGYPSRRENEEVRLEDGGGLSRIKRDKQLLGPFRDGLKHGHDRDRALLALVDHFRMAVESRIAAAPSPLDTVPAAIVVGGLAGFWLLLVLLRRLVVSREEGGDPAPTIYQPAMLGSLFGTPAAFWIYDRLFHLERACKPAAVEAPLPPPPSAAEGVKAPETATETTETPVPVIEERS